MQGEHLYIHFLLLTAQLLVSCVSPIYLLDEFISLLQLLTKELRMLGESKILPFLLLVLIKEGGGGTEFRISLCKSRGGELLF